MRVNKYKVHNSTRGTSSKKGCPLVAERESDRQTDRQTEILPFRVYSARALCVPFCFRFVTVITLCRRLHEACVSTVREACHNTPARTCSTFNVGRPSPSSYCSLLLLPPTRREGPATSSFCLNPPTTRLPPPLSPRAPLPSSSFNFISPRSSSMIMTSKMKNE